jgi:hypothetical protein
MIKSKKKGNAFELQIVNLLKEYDYDAASTRATDRSLDNKGVDVLTSAPFNIQCKAVERLSPGYHEILKNMPTDKTRIIAHKVNNKGTVIVMDITDFADLLLYRPKDEFYNKEMGIK